jgi:hypothetical protein
MGKIKTTFPASPDPKSNSARADSSETMSIDVPGVAEAQGAAIVTPNNVTAIIPRRKK